MQSVETVFSFQNDKSGNRNSGLHEKPENIEKDNISGKNFIAYSPGIPSKEWPRNKVD